MQVYFTTSKKWNHYNFLYGNHTYAEPYSLRLERNQKKKKKKAKETPQKTNKQTQASTQSPHKINLWQ